MGCPTTFSGGWQDPYEGIDLTIDSPFSELPAHPTGNPADWATQAIGKLEAMAAGGGWVPVAPFAPGAATAGTISWTGPCGSGTSGGGTIAVPANPDGYVPTSYSVSSSSSFATFSGDGCSAEIEAGNLESIRGLNAESWWTSLPVSDATIDSVTWNPTVVDLLEPTLALPDWLGSVDGIDAPTITRPTWGDVVSRGSVAITPPTVETPTWDFDDPSAWTDFAEYFEDADPWISEVLLRLQAKLEAIRNGEFSIGPDVWNQIYERAATEIILQGRAREKEGAQAWAARGWNMPGGTAIRMQQLAATEINQMTAKKALEIATQEALQKDQQFQFATQQGLAVETLLEDAWKAMLGRGEQAYVARVRAIADILGTYRRAQSEERITQFKAAADALVEQAKLQYGAESESAKLNSDQEVSQFQGATQIALKQADADTQAVVEGARIVSTQDIEQFRGGVTINTERARIVSQMRIEEGRINGTGYVDWFKTEVGRLIEEARLNQTNSLERRRMRSAEAVETYRQKVTAIIQEAQFQLTAAVESARLSGQHVDAEIRASADVAIAQGQMETQANIETARALSANSIAQIQGTFDFYGRALGVESAAAQAIGNIYAQLAASMYNMYNVSWSGTRQAGVSKSYGVSKGSSVGRSAGTSCTTNYSCEC
jgi:hypothetical protein